jgi:hypothetical protein
MMVKAQYRGDHVVGLYVGPHNVRRHFSKRLRVVELQLDSLQIVCGLTPHFWLDKPEIQDPRLCVWLETKRPQDRPCRADIPFALIPSGDNSFRLAPIAEEGRTRLTPTPVKAAQTLIA